MTTLLTWTYVAGYDSRRGVSHRDSRPSALANLRYRRGVPTGRINRNRARRAGAAPARARAVPGSHRAKRQRRAQRTCVHRGRGRPLGRTSTAELNRTSAVIQLPPPVEPGHGDQIPVTVGGHIPVGQLEPAALAVRTTFPGLHHPDPGVLVDQNVQPAQPAPPAVPVVLAPLHHPARTRTHVRRARFCAADGPVPPGCSFRRASPSPPFA